MSKIGKMYMTYQLLGDFLKLKEGHKIVSVYNTAEDNINRKFTLVIEGPDMPIHREAEELVRIHFSRVLNVKNNGYKLIPDKVEKNVN